MSDFKKLEDLFVETFNNYFYELEKEKQLDPDEIIDHAFLTSTKAYKEVASSFKVHNKECPEVRVQLFEDFGAFTVSIFHSDYKREKYLLQRV